MKFPAPPFSPPAPQRHILPNGMVIFLLEDREIPLIRGKALIRTGAIHDPPGKTGLARLAGQLLVQGGTAKLPGSRLDQVLENLAIEMGSEFGSQSGSISVNALAEDTDEALRLFADVLRRPAFDPDKLELAKRKMAEGVRRTADDPDDLSFREFRRLLYDGDPRGRSATVEEIAALTGDDVLAFYRRFVHPDRIILGFSGDFKPADFLARLDTLLGDWSPSGEPPPPAPIPNPESSDRYVNLIEKDLDQATVIVGHFAPPKDSYDYVPFMLADYILGGAGFGSRLTREIRSNRGLAYSVGSFYRGDIGYGVFVASGKTKNESAPEVLSLTADIMTGMKREGISGKELAWAREAIINGMIFRYDSSADIVGEAMGLEYDRLPLDFNRRIRERIENCTAEEVGKAALKYLDPRSATVVVLGRVFGSPGEWLPGREIRRWVLGAGGRVVPAP